MISSIVWSKIHLRVRQREHGKKFEADKREDRQAGTKRTRTNKMCGFHPSLRSIARQAMVIIYEEEKKYKHDHHHMLSSNNF
jgi:hypothetical protein